jgi:PEGA domain
VLFWFSGTHAQSTTAPVEPAGYRATIDEALREYEAGHFEEARSLFGHAHQLFPNARTERGLGMVEFEMRNYVESIHLLEAALGERVKPLTGSLRTDTERLLARAHQFVARVIVEANPATARVLVDGEPHEAPLGRPVVLPVGDHVLELQASGYQAEKRKLRVRGGEAQTLRMVLAKRSTSPPSASTTSASEEASGMDRSPSASRRWYRSPWLWTAVGAVVAGGGAGAVLATQDRGGGVASPYQGNAGSVEAP